MLNRTVCARVLILMTMTLAACGGSRAPGANPANTSGKTTPPPNRVAWDGVSRDLGKAVDDVPFQTGGIQRLNVNAFGFSDDAEVVYSSDVAAGTGLIRIYKVWAGTGNFGELRAVPKASTLELTSFGNYQCSISVRDGVITQLDGGCIVRLQVLLPPEAPIEVNVAGKRLTKRFVPVSAEEFLSQLDAAVWSTEKLKVIDSYLASYTETGTQPSLNTIQLGAVMDEFIRTDEKLEVLKRLHPAVVDRQNLSNLIDAKFPSFERQRARQLAGL